MPTYRIGGTFVHMRGTKLAPACVAVMKVDGQLQRCAVPSAFLCDHPDGGGHTCDRPLCRDHAHEVGPNRHYCPTHHHSALTSAERAPGLFTTLVQP